MTDDGAYGAAGAAAVLQKALGFTPAELVDNRAGRLSPAQTVRMTAGQKTSRIGVYIMIGLVVVFVVVIAVVFLSQSTSTPTRSSAVPSWVIVLVIALVVLIMAVSFLRTRRGISRLTGAVLSVEGEANPHTGSFGDANQEGYDTIYRVKIGGINFPVPGPAQVAAFEKGKRYRAYYLKSTTPVIISAELLDS